MAHPSRPNGLSPRREAERLWGRSQVGELGSLRPFQRQENLLPSAFPGCQTPWYPRGSAKTSSQSSPNGLLLHCSASTHANTQRKLLSENSLGKGGAEKVLTSFHQGTKWPWTLPRYQTPGQKKSLCPRNLLHKNSYFSTHSSSPVHHPPPSLWKHFHLY